MIDMLNELRAWCKKVLPLAYSEALSYYEALNKVRKKVNEIIEYVNEVGASAVYRVNGKEPVGGNVNVGTVNSVNNNLPDSNGNVTIETGGGVSSVNGKTGAVNLSASDVGALPDSYTPPVASVNGQTGAVNLGASDVGALPDTVNPVLKVNNTRPDNNGNVNVATPKVEVIASTASTITIQPCPKTYSFGVKTSLTINISGNTQYHFSFKCPSNAITTLTVNGITGISGDALVVGGYYECDIWNGIMQVCRMDVSNP